MVILAQEPFEKESKEIWEGVKPPVESNIAICQLDAVANIGILILTNQCIEGGRSTINGLYLHRNKRICVPDKEIHFQSTLFIPVEVQGISLLDQHIRNHIFIDCTLIGVEVLVVAKIFLYLFVQRADQQSSIPKVDFVIIGVIIAFQWQFRKFQAMANIDDACIIQPFHCPNIIAVSSVAGNLGNLELFVILPQKGRNLAIYTQNFSLVQTGAYLVISSS